MRAGWGAGDEKRLYQEQDDAWIHSSHSSADDFARVSTHLLRSTAMASTGLVLAVRGSSDILTSSVTAGHEGGRGLHPGSLEILLPWRSALALGNSTTGIEVTMASLPRDRIVQSGYLEQPSYNWKEEARLK